MHSCMCKILRCDWSVRSADRQKCTVGDKSVVGLATNKFVLTHVTDQSVVSVKWSLALTFSLHRVKFTTKFEACILTHVLTVKTSHLIKVRKLR